MSLSKAKLIGISGLMGSGKDTVATFIQSWRPREFERYSFAKPLKEATKVMFGWSDVEIEDRRVKEEVDPFWGFSPRKAMQLLGTEFGRNLLREDIWLLAAEKAMQEIFKRGHCMLITDVRFENEASWVREHGGTVLHVVDPNNHEPRDSVHMSEQGVLHQFHDSVLINDKSKGLAVINEELARLW